MVQFSNGHVYTADSDPVTGLKNGGARTLFEPMLSDTVSEVAIAVAAAAAASASALTAVNSPGTTATSTTSNDFTGLPGNKTWTIQAGKSLALGQYLSIADTAAAATNYMLGRITGYNSVSGSLTVAVATSAGSGTKTAWTMALAVDPAGAVSTSRTLTAAGLVTGGGTLAADRTFTVTAATATDLWAGSSTTTAVTPASLKNAAALIALTDGATVTPDMATGKDFTWTIGGNRTLANPSNPVVGQRGTIIITQDGTGSRTIAFGANWKKPGGTITLSTAAAAVDRLEYHVVTASVIHVTLTKAFS